MPTPTNITMNSVMYRLSAGSLKNVGIGESSQKLQAQFGKGLSFRPGQRESTEFLRRLGSQAQQGRLDQWAKFRVEIRFEIFNQYRADTFFTAFFTAFLRTFLTASC